MRKYILDMSKKYGRDKLHEDILTYHRLNE